MLSLPMPVHHGAKITVGAGLLVMIVAASDSAVLAAVVAGGFTIVNTVLTIALTRPRRRSRKDEDDE